jgi:uncharacterized protein YdhG (YjbR/CyaY superfamily)
LAERVGRLQPTDVWAQDGEVPVSSGTPASIDEYITACSPDVQPILRKLRAIVRRTAPGARETISYRMPAFMLNGVLVYFAAFKGHIGVYPPVRADARLQKAVARYAGEKGNLRFPLAEPIPYDLFARIVKVRVAQNAAKAAARRKARA